MPELLLDSLLPPVPRIIYDSVVKYSDIQKFVLTLEDRKVVRENTPEGMLPQHDEVGPSLKNLFRRLISEGLNEQIEMQLLEMKAYILKVKHKHSELKEQSQNGRIRLDREDILCHDYPLIDKSSKLDPKKKGRQDGDLNSNLEWHHIFNDGHSTAASPSGDLNVSPVQAGSPSSVGQIPPTAAASLGEYTIPERNLWTERPSECRFDVDGGQSGQSGGQSLAVGGKDGSLSIMRIDRNSSKMALQHAIHTDENEHNDANL